MAYAAYPIRALVALGAGLSLVLVVGVLSLSTALVSISALGIALAGLGAIAWLTRERLRLRAESSDAIAAIGAQTLDLPRGLRNRMPLILVIGDGLDQLFDERRAIVGDGAIWLRIDQPAHLREMALALRVWRAGRAPDGVLLAIAPAAHTTDEAVAEGLRIARGAISDAAHALGRFLPCFLAVYQRWSGGEDDPVRLRWHGVGQVGGFAPTETFEDVLLAAELGVQRAQGDTRAAWNASGLAATVEWTRRSVLAVLADQHQPSAPCRPHAIGWIDQGPATTAASPLGRYLIARSGITPPSQPASAAGWLLPQPLILSAPPRIWIPAWVRGAIAAFSLIMLFLAAGLWISAQNNHRLLARAGEDLARLRATAHASIAEQHRALAAVKADRDEIDRYERLGLPWGLDFGLYHGAALAAPLTRAINGYREPETMVTLDSMSLFDAGSAGLKPDATRALVTALEFIKAHAKSRILIAGYTDTTGNPDANQFLSLRRAAAVRDWLVAASDVPVTRIAIQGMGALRPLADNGTANGRARNRRVEITLIPDVHGQQAVNPERPAPADQQRDHPVD